MSKDEPQTLQDVARAASDRHEGARGRGLGRVAKAAGLTLSYTTVDKMLDGTYKSTPKRETLEALAKLSGYTREQVYRVAGVPLPLKPLRDDLPPDADTLTGPQRRVVIDAIRLFAQQNLELHGLEDQLAKAGDRDDQRPASMNQGSTDPSADSELERRRREKHRAPATTRVPAAHPGESEGEVTNRSTIHGGSVTDATPDDENQDPADDWPDA